MLERATWGSGQIARPGFPGTHPEGEFFWVYRLVRMTKKLLRRLETRAKQLLERLWAGGFFGVPARS